MRISGLSSKFQLIIFTLCVISLVVVLKEPMVFHSTVAPSPLGDSHTQKEPLTEYLNTEKPKPLLTLFTTFINVDRRLNIQSNVVRNWASFMPHVQPILYATFTNGTLLDLAKSYGWLVYPVPRVNEKGTPFLRDLFFDALNRTESIFYGYCNGDILFTEGLLHTIQGIRRDIDVLNTTLVIGRRTNVIVDPNSTIPFYKYNDIKTRAKTGKLFTLDAEDYFIMSNVTGFPWKNIKDVVIGRPGYDNYLVAISIMSNKTVVDGTSTILALHQTGPDGNYAGAKNTDSNYNKKLIGKFNYNKGLTRSAQYTSHFDFRGNVYLVRR